MNEEINQIWIKEIKDKYDEKKGTPQELENYKEIAREMNYIENVNKNSTTKTIFERLIECDHVYETLPVFQENSCTTGYNWINLIQSYMSLLVFVYLISVSMSRFANYVQKKINEKKVKKYIIYIK